MAEFSVPVDENMSVQQLIYFSDLAHSRREERRKAAKEGKQWIA